MSQAAALAFIDHLEKDASLKQSMASLPKRDLQSLLQTAATAGFVFSEADWKEAVKTKFSPELSDAELEHVAGGAYEFYVAVKGTKQGQFKP
jgi:predicted ribosomally synthesized peptide with nif11-like leader